MSDQPHPVDVHVGKRLRMRRTIVGMSQEALGNAIGITFQQIQKYERGTNRMGSSRLYEFSKILGVKVDYFFEGYSPTDEAVPGGMSESDMPAFEHEQLTSRETLEMMRTYYKITSPKLRKSLYELMRAMAEGNLQ